MGEQRRGNKKRLQKNSGRKWRRGWDLWRCWLLLSGQPGSFLVRRHPSHEVLRTRGLDTQGDESGNPLATALRVVSAATELFGRLAPGVTVEQARAELRSVYGAMTKEHPEAYSAKRTFKSGPSDFVTRSPRAPGPCCWCCLQRRRWSSSSRVAT
jgi:hypothetical protein